MTLTCIHSSMQASVSKTLSVAAALMQAYFRHVASLA